MAFSLFKVVKGLLIREENSLVPKELEIIPGGDGGVKTTLTTSQTGTDKIITLPDETDTLVGKITVDTLENKSIDSTGGVNTITTAASGNLAATELNAALSELQSDIDTRTLETDFQAHLTDTVDAHDASAISVVASGNIASTNVQAALEEIQTDLDGRASRALDNLTSPTAINQHLLPASLQNLGSTSSKWANLYLSAWDNLSNPKNGIIFDNVGSTSNIYSRYANPVQSHGLYIETTGTLSVLAGTTLSISSSDVLAISGASMSLSPGDSLLSVSASRVIDLLDPVDPQDAATKNYVDSTLSSGFANTTLSNLTSPTALNQDLLPSVDNTRKLGSSTLTYSEAYINSIKSSTLPNINVASRTLATSAGSVSVNYGTGVLSSTSSANTSIDWTNRILKDSSAIDTIDYSSSTSIKMGKNISYRNQGLTTEIMSKVIGSQSIPAGTTVVSEFELNTASYDTAIIEYSISATAAGKVVGTLHIAATSGGGGLFSIADTNTAINAAGSSNHGFVFSGSMSSGVLSVSVQNATGQSASIKYVVKKFAV